jgi:hypothetical protein
MKERWTLALMGTMGALLWMLIAFAVMYPGLLFRGLYRIGALLCC